MTAEALEVEARAVEAAQAGFEEMIDGMLRNDKYDGNWWGLENIIQVGRGCMGIYVVNILLKHVICNSSTFCIRSYEVVVRETFRSISSKAGLQLSDCFFSYPYAVS